MKIPRANRAQMNLFLKRIGEGEGWLRGGNFLLSPPRVNVAARHHEKKFDSLWSWTGCSRDDIISLQSDQYKFSTRVPNLAKCWNDRLWIFCFHRGHLKIGRRQTTKIAFVSSKNPPPCIFLTAAKKKKKKKETTRKNKSSSTMYIRLRCSAATPLLWCRAKSFSQVFLQTKTGRKVGQRAFITTRMCTRRSLRIF